MGKKSRDPARERPTAALYVRPPPALKQAVVAEAQRRGVSVNELCVQALSAGVSAPD